jgi:hypothetical protein
LTGYRLCYIFCRDVRLNLLDWVVIALYFLISLGIGLYYRRKATTSVSDFFVSGRNVTWWLAGTGFSGHGAAFRRGHLRRFEQAGL